MHTLRTRFVCKAGTIAASMVFLTGCATQGTHTRQFDPLPTAQVGEKELEPVESPRSVADLLAEADKAHRRANESFEKKDYEAALRNYTTMMQLMIEADLDPAVYYDMREEFDRILTASVRVSGPRGAETFRDVASGLVYPSDLDVPDPLPQAVLDEIDKIQNAYNGNFQRGLDRSGQHDAFIREELRKADLPEDLIWLAMVESQFWPKAVSRAGAKGMWQFMPATARRYGLRIDNYVDERLSVEKSTRAAVAYLSDLRDMFNGNWPLAVSSYNMGEYGMERAIAMNGGDSDLWRLIETPPAANVIRQETKEFYPKLIASIIVAKNPEEYGFVPSSKEPLRYTRVPVRGSYSLSALDKACDLPVGTLAELNPELHRGATPSDGEFALAVPEPAKTTLVAALRNVPRTNVQAPSSSASGGVHVVRRGDTLSGIAERYRVSMRDLQQTNKLRSASHLRVGQKLVVPGASAAAIAAASVNAETPAQAESSARSYRVRRGDTLYEIAKAHGVSVNDLRSWNNLRGNSIYAGQELALRGQAVAKSAPTAREDAPVRDAHRITHIVRAGEYPAKVAQQYGVELDKLLAWNGLSRRSVLHVGDKLVVETSAPVQPAPAAQGSKPANLPQPAGKEKATYKVARGDSPWTIANKHNVPLEDFLAWNGLTKKSVLKVGQTVTLYAAGKGAPAASAPATQGKRIEHVVQKGHTPIAIANRYGVSLKDLFAWNNWSKTPTLHIGQKVVVYQK